MKRLAHVALIVALTLLTQVGGLIYAGALWARSRIPLAQTRWGFAALFVALYVLAWFPVERVAALTGRVSLPCIARENLSVSAFSCVLHRHYVTRETRDVAFGLANAVNVRFPGALTRALDGNFPFFDGFPLPPHLSHDDGEKLDLAFYYQHNGEYRRGALGSPVGYWKFERPREGELETCPPALASLRWDMGWFAPLTRGGLSLDEARTRFALRWLAREGASRGVGKVFVEPHLAQRLGVSGRVIRFQGCRAARHDDHMHVQMR